MAIKDYAPRSKRNTTDICATAAAAICRAFPIPVAVPFSFGRTIVSLMAIACCLPLAARDAAAQSGAPDPAFDILEYRIEGNSTLSNLAIERAVYPHLGEKKRIADVERARVSLENA